MTKSPVNWIRKKRWCHIVLTFRFGTINPLRWADSENRIELDPDYSSDLTCKEDVFRLGSHIIAPEAPVRLCYRNHNDILEQKI